jgi:hypothetical protein
VEVAMADAEALPGFLRPYNSFCHDDCSQQSSPVVGGS